MFYVVKKESSFTTGWGSTVDSSRQDSQPLSEPEHGTLGQRSFLLHKEGSFSRPQSPGDAQSIASTPASSIALGVSSPGAIKHVPREAGGSPLVSRNTRTSSFNLESLGDGIIDQRSLQHTRPRSPASHYEKGSSGSLVHSDIGRSGHLRHRNNNASSSFWSDDDEQEEEIDQDMEDTYDTNDGNHDYRSMVTYHQRYSLTLWRAEIKG